MTDLKRIPTPWSYSLAVEAGDFVYLGIHTGKGADFTAQFNDAMQHMQATLAQFDLKLDSLIKIQVWLKNIQDLPVMEKLVMNYFAKDGYPTRMTATTQFIDEGRLVMVEGIAYRRKQG
jgi:2-iminobutanoate/2-iminopropanoate deaminase